MKKIVLFAFTVAFSLFTYAQTYTVDMTGDIGDNMVLGIDTAVLPGDIDLDLGDTGTAVTWNFQGLDLDNTDTLKFDQLNVQESTDFPTGNVVVESGLGRIVFKRDVANGLYLLGTSLSFGPYQLSLNYVPAQRTLPASSSLHTTDNSISYIDERVFVGIDTTVGSSPFDCHIDVDSIMIKRRSNYTVHFDAVGELRLPVDTFPNALRAITTEATVDSIFIFSSSGFTGLACAAIGTVPPGVWTLAPQALVSLSGLADSSVMHNVTRAAVWYVTDIVGPVCAVDYEQDPTDTTWLSVRYKSTNAPDVGFEQVVEIPMTLYPNPATDVLMIKTTADISGSTMMIMNAQGQQIRTVNMNGSNTIDVSGLSNGMYFYQLTNGKNIQKQGKFLIKK